VWLKTVDGNYYNMLTGSTLAVKQGVAQSDWRIYVMNTGGNTPVACLQNGYRSKDDAEQALSDVMEQQDVTTIDVPEYDDEESEEDTEDEEVIYEDNYETVSDEDLRNELTSRGLSTRGNTRALVNRLRKDDAAKRSSVEETV